MIVSDYLKLNNYKTWRIEEVQNSGRTFVYWTPPNIWPTPTSYILINILNASMLLPRPDMPEQRHFSLDKWTTDGNMNDYICTSRALGYQTNAIPTYFVCNNRSIWITKEILLHAIFVRNKWSWMAFKSCFEPRTAIIWCFMSEPDLWQIAFVMLHNIFLNKCKFLNKL